MMANGSVVSVTAKVNSNGLMVPNIKDNGKIIELTAKVNSLILMETSTTANGKTIRPTDMAYIITLMVLCTRATGRMTFSTVKEKSLGPMVQSMKVGTWPGRSMVSASIAGMMAPNIMVSGSKIRSRASVPTAG